MKKATDETRFDESVLLTHQLTEFHFEKSKKKPSVKCTGDIKTNVQLFVASALQRLSPNKSFQHRMRVVHFYTLKRKVEQSIQRAISTYPAWFISLSI